MSDRDETVAERIAALRKSLPPREGRKSRLGHMSVEDFAEHLGTTKTRVIAWEKGKAYPDAINRERLSTASEGRFQPESFMQSVEPDPLEALEGEVADLTVGLEASRKANNSLRLRVSTLERAVKELQALAPREGQAKRRVRSEP